MRQRATEIPSAMYYWPMDTRRVLRIRDGKPFLTVL
jgi:hypothetical protein